MSQATASLIMKGATNGLIDSRIDSYPDFTPRLVVNNFESRRKIISDIEYELAHCSSFSFCVAFITLGGIAPLLPIFKTLESRGVKGRILTTDYLSFSEPEALRKLGSLSNVEVRMAEERRFGHGFHPKGYIFGREDGTYRALVGSANMTGKALSENEEWNLRFAFAQNGSMAESLLCEFERLWANSSALSSVLETYAKIYEEKKKTVRADRVISFENVKLEPNAMQARFVDNLDRMIEAGEDRFLLVSATGTGKTFASAFGLRHRNPRRILFLAHRETILKQAVQSYRRVLGNVYTYGILSGNEKCREATCLFATMQTMSEDKEMRLFQKDAFDFIVIDEVHRAGSDSYQKIMNYFRPQYWLGMTASPERLDGFNIYELFDNNLVYEIRLQQALEENLLCPFHYYGITDFQYEGSEISEETLFSDFRKLVSSERVNYIIDQAEYYGHSGDRLRGLVFCSAIKEARELSRLFNERGYRTCALSGDDSPQKREEAIARLEASADFEDRLDYIFTVDIFNEGVDIPAVNQVLMLRPTQSPVVFVQQLGRGLRKFDEKDFVVVIDFIGNYTNNYMIPIALSGDRSYSKDAIRKYVMEGSRVISGCSSIHFDEITKERIFKSIDAQKTSQTMLKKKYFALKDKLGRVPSMVDFVDFGEVDPLLFVEKKGSYCRFASTVDKDYSPDFSAEEWTVLEFLSNMVANGMRPHELLMIRQLVEERQFTKSTFLSEVESYGKIDADDGSYESAIRVLNTDFLNSPGDKKRYATLHMIETDGCDGSVHVSSDFAEMADNKEFRTVLLDIVEFGLARCGEKYGKTIDGFTLYEKYSRKDVCRLLNWPQDDSSTLYGYRVKYGTCPIFVTYKKSEDISATTQYADHFIDQGLFNWMSRSRLKIESPEIQKIIAGRDGSVRMYLFVKKSDDEGSDFYFMGKVTPRDWTQEYIFDDEGGKVPVVNFILDVDPPVREDIYEYLEGAID